jgi:hypothetical protein
MKATFVTGNDKTFEEKVNNALQVISDQQCLFKDGEIYAGAVVDIKFSVTKESNNALILWIMEEVESDHKKYGL